LDLLESAKMGGRESCPNAFYGRPAAAWCSAVLTHSCVYITGSAKIGNCEVTAMTTELRKTGVDVVGDMPWGTHFCLFYETTADLLEITVSYCKAGLESGEFCLWVVAEPLTVEDATQAMHRAVPNSDRYFSDHSIEIVAARDWYLQDGAFDLNRVIRGWNEKLTGASARGYAGVRVTGDTAWLEKKDWKDFCEYEESLNQAVANQRLTILCTYPLAACGAGEILDVVRTHQFAVTNRRGNWDVIETAGHKQAKAEIKRLNEELEQRVQDRTSELTLLNSELTREVLQRQSAEEALRQSEAYLAAAQRVSRTGSFGWSIPSGRIVWSDETFRILEHDPANQPTQEVILQRTHPDDRALVRETLDRAARERKAFDFEHRLLMPDGSVKYIRVGGHPSIKDESGHCEFVGAVTDITESKRVEESLRRSERYLAEAQRLTHTGSWGWRIPGHDASHLSGEWYRMYGFDPEAGVPTWEERLQRIHPEDRAIHQETITRSIREKSDYEIEFRILPPSGTVRYIHAVGHPVMGASGDVVELVGSSIDITERKRAELLRDGENCILEMIARDALLEEILENLVRVVEAQFAGLLCSVLLLDEDGQHARHGAAPSLPDAYSKAIDGLSIGPTAGSCGTAMYRRETVIVTDILEDPLWKAYRGVAEPYGFRACWSTPILAHSGKPLGSFAMYYREPRSPSPAEIRALEMATHLAGIAIERKLAREERERLRRAQADLAHINRVTTLGELTASLAHDIKQPIAAAVTDAKTCLRWLHRDEPELAEASEAALRAVKDVTRAADIINRISLLFKKEALQHELVDVNVLIKEMIVLLRGEASRYSVSIHGELGSDLPMIMADRVQLQQVLMNLMLNGIEAMKDIGVGDLTIKSQQHDNRQVLISVGDTGVGLEPDKAEQIFNAFFSTKPQGTGMGLPISKSIIESHGGRLWATSNSGPGATLLFTLPSEVTAYRAA
jgi:C4-dicarboxylate-specific signal transduction histidine kinase